MAILPGAMDPAFEDAAYNMKIGEISRPVKTELGYSIIRIEDRFPQPILTEYQYLKDKGRIERVLKIKKKQPAEISYIREQLQIEKIILNDDGIGKLYSLFNPSGIRLSEDQILRNQNVVCSEYKGKTFTIRELHERILNLPYFHREKAADLNNLKPIIKGFYLQDKLLETAEKLGYDNNNEIENVFLESSKKLFLQFKFDQILRAANLPDSLAIDFYNKNKDYFVFPRQIDVRELTVAKKTLADSLFNLLQNGADFGTLAVKYSLRRFSAENNGNIGLSSLNKFGQFSNLLWNSNPGQPLKPVEFEGVFVIFELMKKTDSRQQTFEEVKEKALLASKFKYEKKIIKDYINEIYKKVNVTFNDTLLASIDI